jgi:arginine repressor
VIQKNEQSYYKFLKNCVKTITIQRDFTKICLKFLHQDLLLNLGVLEGKAQYAAKIDQFFLKEIVSMIFIKKRQ